MLRGVAEALEPPLDITPSQWAEENVRLPPEGSSGGVFELETRPFFREILDAIANPMTRRISIKGCAQLGKTTVLKAGILAMSAIEPAPFMLCTPDKDKTLEIREEMYEMAEECPPLKHRIPPPWRRNARRLDFGRSLVYLAWSGGRQTLRGRSCKKVFATEVDVYKHDAVLGSPVALFEARTKSWFESLILEESTPSDENSLIDAQYEAGDRRTWHVECPHCGTHQELRFFVFRKGEHAGCGGVGGYTDQAGNLLEPEEARKQAHYICIEGCKIDRSYKKEMINGGQWVPAGQEVNKQGELVGTPERSSRHRSYHLSGLLSDLESWGSLAAQYLQARLNGTLREFFNNILGLKFSGRGKSSTWEQLAKSNAGAYLKTQIPSAADFCVCASDVQGGEDPRAYWIVRAYGPWKTSWLVDWGISRPQLNLAGMMERNSDLHALGKILANRYAVIGGPNALGKLYMAVRVQGIDTNFRMHDIHGYITTQDQERVRALRGDHSVDRADRYRMTRVEKSARDGTPYEGGLELWGVASGFYRDGLMDRMAADLDQPGAWYLPDNIIEAGGKDYLQQMVNKFPMTRRRPNGKVFREYVMKSKQIGDHFFDCEVEADALADMVVGGLGWDPSGWPWREKKPKKEQKEVAHPRDEGGFSAR